LKTLVDVPIEKVGNIRWRNIKKSGTMRTGQSSGDFKEVAGGKINTASLLRKRGEGFLAAQKRKTASKAGAGGKTGGGRGEVYLGLNWESLVTSLQQMRWGTPATRGVNRD